MFLFLEKIQFSYVKKSNNPGINSTLYNKIGWRGYTCFITCFIEFECIFYLYYYINCLYNVYTWSDVSIFLKHPWHVNTFSPHLLFFYSCPHSEVRMPVINSKKWSVTHLELAITSTKKITLLQTNKSVTVVIQVILISESSVGSSWTSYLQDKKSSCILLNTPER